MGVQGKALSFTRYKHAMHCMAGKDLSLLKIALLVSVHVYTGVQFSNLSLERFLTSTGYHPDLLQALFPFLTLADMRKCEEV
jgi:hypothetical protein